MTKYELYLIFHIAGSVIWIGAAFLMAVLGARAIVTGDPSRSLVYAHDSEWLGLRLYLPSNLVVLAFAFLLVGEGWSYDLLWIQLGLAGFGLSFVTGAAVFGPGWAKVGKLAARDGIDSPTVRARIRRLVAVCFFDLGVLLAVLFAMVVKPTADDPGALAITAALAIVAGLIGYLVTVLGSKKTPEVSSPAPT